MIKVYTPKDTDIFYDASVDFKKKHLINGAVNLVQYDSHPIIRAQLYLDGVKYFVPAYNANDIKRKDYTIKVDYGIKIKESIRDDILGVDPTDRSIVYFNVPSEVTKITGTRMLSISLFFDFLDYTSKNIAVIEPGRLPIYYYDSHGNELLITYDQITGELCFNGAHKAWFGLNLGRSWTNMRIPTIPNDKKITTSFIPTSGSCEMIEKGRYEQVVMFYIGCVPNNDIYSTANAIQITPKNYQTTTYRVSESSYIKTNDSNTVYLNWGGRSDQDLWKFNNYKIKLQVEVSALPTKYETPSNVQRVASGHIVFNVKENPIKEGE